MGLNTVDVKVSQFDGRTYLTVTKIAWRGSPAYPVMEERRYIEDVDEVLAEIDLDRLVEALALVMTQD